MKAERRHELQTNTLAQFLTDLPIYLRLHANKLLVGVIVVCGIILLIRYRNNATAQTHIINVSYLANSHRDIDTLESLYFSRESGVGQAQERNRIAIEVNTAVDQVLQSTKDPDDAAL
ncbi:MAG TPA: hypothetical protein VKK61_01590, partial [Tepidisphaeraceae bacterium]|nr:hypothetical protein [Tepidisphaeraceae bacterium]